MSRSILAGIFLTVWSIILVIALTWGTEYVWPDYVHVKYGFPLIWGIHVLNTLQGPVDVWRIDITALCLDLIIWLSVMTVGLLLILHAKIRG